MTRKELSEKYHNIHLQTFENILDEVNTLRMHAVYEPEKSENFSLQYSKNYILSAEDNLNN